MAFDPRAKDVVIIHLGRQLPAASTQPTRTTSVKTRLPARAGLLSLFGFAPDGVYRAAAIAGARGGLLPHPFTLPPTYRGGLLSVALSLG